MQNAGDTNFSKPLHGKTGILYRAARRSNTFTAPTPEVQKSPSQTGRAFLHTKRDTACAARDDGCEGEQPEEEPDAQYPKEQVEKDFTHSREKLPLL